MSDAPQAMTDVTEALERHAAVLQRIGQESPQYIREMAESLRDVIQTWERFNRAVDPTWDERKVRRLLQ